ncbi:MAG: Ig domain-containing protein [Dehalococcoidia bacterium]|nr:Ig domain-containing protein [Dehalococcoidia bacterium]
MRYGKMIKLLRKKLPGKRVSPHRGISLMALALGIITGVCLLLLVTTMACGPRSFTQQRADTIEFLKSYNDAFVKLADNADTLNNYNPEDLNEVNSACTMWKLQIDDCQHKIEALIPASDISELAELKGAGMEFLSEASILFSRCITATNNGDPEQLEKVWQNFDNWNPDTSKLDQLETSLLIKYNIADSEVNYGGTAGIPPVQSTLTITTSSLPAGKRGTAYSQTLQATGGSPPYFWERFTATMPPGLTLDRYSGVIQGMPTAAGTYNFEIELSDDAGYWVTKTLSITIAEGTGPGTGPGPVIISFKANPSNISSGQSSTLSWKDSGASLYEIKSEPTDPSIYPLFPRSPGTGQVVVHPTTTTNYTLTVCDDDYNCVTQTTQVIVSGSGPGPKPGSLPVISSFDANPANISAGQYTTLSWMVSGASNVTIDQGIGDVSSVSQKIVYPNTTTVYTLTAYNASGIVSQTTQITVSGSGPGPRPSGDYTCPYAGTYMGIFAYEYRSLMKDGEWSEWKTDSLRLTVTFAPSMNKEEANDPIFVQECLGYRSRAGVVNTATAHLRCLKDNRGGWFCPIISVACTESAFGCGLGSIPPKWSSYAWFPDPPTTPSNPSLQDQMIHIDFPNGSWIDTCGNPSALTVTSDARKLSNSLDPNTLCSETCGNPSVFETNPNYMCVGWLNAWCYGGITSGHLFDLEQLKWFEWKGKSWKMDRSAL